MDIQNVIPFLMFQHKEKENNCINKCPFTQKLPLNS